MAKTSIDATHSAAVQGLVKKFTNAWVTTGRSYDRVYVDGKVRYFVARDNFPTNNVLKGDIFGAKTEIYPNLNWFFGNLETIDQWEWTNKFHAEPTAEASVMLVKSYGTYNHYKRVPVKQNS